MSKSIYNIFRQISAEIWWNFGRNFGRNVLLGGAADAEIGAKIDAKTGAKIDRKKTPDWAPKRRKKSAGNGKKG